MRAAIAEELAAQPLEYVVPNMDNMDNPQLQSDLKLLRRHLQAKKEDLLKALQIYERIPNTRAEQLIQGAPTCQNYLSPTPLVSSAPQ
jgi:hypothetical protein